MRSNATEEILGYVLSVTSDMYIWSSASALEGSPEGKVR